MTTKLKKMGAGTRRNRSARLELLELEDRRLMTLLGQSLFPADNAWNQRITAAPVAANSTAIINNITSLYGNGRLHPDFGQDYRNSNDLYGIPFNIVHGNTQPKVHVVLDLYEDESDPVDFPIPANAVIEGDYQNGPRVGLNNRGDSHLLVWDADNNVAYELYRASRPSENADGNWHADQLSVWDMKVNSFRTLGWTSADAAGLSILAGLVRPDEALPVSQGGQGVINHAIRFTLRNDIILNKYIYPASHIANSNTNQTINPPMGSRFRLKASVDISQLNPQSKIVAQAMKDYGMILADNGSNFFFTGASYSVDASNNFTVTWNDNDIQSSTLGLKSLHYSDFEVVDLKPIVTGLSAASGAAGSTLTVNGSNFSGAAGRLQVLFGTTPGTNVTILDDSRLTVVVPAGTGTVDVRVKSGITVSGASGNIGGTTFGYGTSAITTNDRFTYSGATNTAPTVASPAAASPSIVTGTFTDLAVLGADDGGEANLLYTWSVIASPTGSSPVFSANGTNGAKATRVTFNRAGSYQFLVTIRDAAGLSTTSSAGVTVNQTITRIAVTTTSTTIHAGASRQFTATAFDQFNLVLVAQPTFTWSLSNTLGTISSTGRYKAPGTTGTSTVRATAGGVTGSLNITVYK
jgi:hypothetical protein